MYIYIYIYITLLIDGFIIVIPTVKLSRDLYYMTSRVNST